MGYAARVPERIMRGTRFGCSGTRAAYPTTDRLRPPRQPHWFPAHGPPIRIIVPPARLADDYSANRKASFIDQSL